MTCAHARVGRRKQRLDRFAVHIRKLGEVIAYRTIRSNSAKEDQIVNLPAHAVRSLGCDHGGSDNNVPRLLRGDLQQTGYNRVAGSQHLIDDNDRPAPKGCALSPGAVQIALIANRIAKQDNLVINVVLRNGARAILNKDLRSSHRPNSLLVVTGMLNLATENDIQRQSQLFRQRRRHYHSTVWNTHYYSVRSTVALQLLGQLPASLLPARKNSFCRCFQIEKFWS